MTYRATTASGVVIYRVCDHRWPRKMWDWLHLRWHPRAHVLRYIGLDWAEADNSHQLTISWNANGVFTIDGPTSEE